MLNSALNIASTNGLQLLLFTCAKGKSPMTVTSPSFCTTTNERVYITTSSGKGANGGSQGAVGDRRAALCGANAAGAGGL